MWLRKAVAMREPGRGIGGYQTFDRGKRYDNPGSSGIALALLAAASSVPPDWDRLLMAS
jgi:class I lanthipeptide synthase